ncbi:MAG: M16 family metallopeptidase [Flavobacteriaceae bacterium]
MKKTVLFVGVYLCVLTPLCSQVDRSSPPPAGPTPEIQLKSPQKFVLPNGLRLFVVEDHKLPRVSTILLSDNPPQIEGEIKGVNAILGNMLGKGSRSINKNDFDDEIDFIGATINFGATSAALLSLSRYFSRGIELMADAILFPSFLETEFTKEKQLLLQAIKRNENAIQAILRRVENSVMYGASDPRGESIQKESIAKIELDDVKRYFNANLNPSNAYLFVIGDVQFKAVKKKIVKLFRQWKDSPKALGASPSVKQPESMALNLIDVPNATQSEVSIIFTADLKKKHPDYFPMLLADVILGGGPQGRLFQNLREDKGYAYGAYSSFSTSKYHRAVFRASSSVRNQVVDSAAIELLKEFKRMVDTFVSEEELKVAKAIYLGEFIRALESPSTQAQFAFDIEYLSLPKNFYVSYLQKINAVTVADIQRVTQKYFHIDKAQVFVAGNASEIREKIAHLKPFGKILPLSQWDKKGNAIPSNNRN